MNWDLFGQLIGYGAFCLGAGVLFGYMVWGYERQDRGWERFREWGRRG